MGAQTAPSGNSTRRLNTLMALGTATVLATAGCSKSTAKNSVAPPAPKDVTLSLTANDIHGGKNGAEADWITTAGLFAMDGIWVGDFADAGYIKPLSEVAS